VGISKIINYVPIIISTLPKLLESKEWEIRKIIPEVILSLINILGQGMASYTQRLFSAFSILKRDKSKIVRELSQKTFEKLLQLPNSIAPPISILNSDHILENFDTQFDTQFDNNYSTESSSMPISNYLSQTPMITESVIQSNIFNQINSDTVLTDMLSAENDTQDYQINLLQNGNNTSTISKSDELLLNLQKQQNDIFTLLSTINTKLETLNTRVNKLELDVAVIIEKTQDFY